MAYISDVAKEITSKQAVAKGVLYKHAIFIHFTNRKHKDSPGTQFTPWRWDRIPPP
jgi:hypothetical protein